jgi:hypothetical protein
MPSSISLPLLYQLSYKRGSKRVPMYDDLSVASNKTTDLFEVLRPAVDSAITLDGYMCEALSVAKAIGVNALHIDDTSIAFLLPAA